MNTNLKVGGVFTFEQIRNGKVIDSWEEKNLVVDEGLDYVLDVALSAATAETTWYLGLYEGIFTPLSTTTGANVATNSTETTDYTPTPRPTWVEAGVTTQKVTNSVSPAAFTFTADVTVQGAFLISTCMHRQLLDTLLSASNFTSPRVMLTNDILNVTYTITSAAV